MILTIQLLLMFASRFPMWTHSLSNFTNDLSTKDGGICKLAPLMTKYRLCRVKGKRTQLRELYENYEAVLRRADELKELSEVEYHRTCWNAAFRSKPKTWWRRLFVDSRTSDQVWLTQNDIIAFSMRHVAQRPAKGSRKEECGRLESPFALINPFCSVTLVEPCTHFTVIRVEWFQLLRCQPTWKKNNIWSSHYWLCDKLISFEPEHAVGISFARTVRPTKC